jgi:serpin B
MHIGDQHISRRSALKLGMAAAASFGLARRPLVASAGTLSPVNSVETANMDFAFKLQSVLARSSTGANLFFSPLSISLALAMVYNGARGQTMQAIARTTDYTGISPASLNQAMSALLAGLQQRDANVKLQIADSLWYRQGIGVSPTFMATLKSIYGAPATALDFASPAAPATINTWVSRQTHGLIPTIVRHITPQEVLYLINALYFKARWSEQFAPSSTAPGPFTLQNGQKTKLPMMSREGSYAYAMTAAYQAISLPYESGQFSMVIVLPATGSELATFQAGLNTSSWQRLIGTLSPQHGRLQLPRFTVDYGAGLGRPLTQLGMGIAFDPNHADLSGMFTTNRGFISNVQHRAVMEVNEQGTKAAAVTAVGVGLMAVAVPTFTMVVNRPFFCAIRDNVSGTLLFMGSIVDPR